MIAAGSSTTEPGLHTKYVGCNDMLKGFCYRNPNSTNLERQFDLPVSKKSKDCDILSNMVSFRL